MTHHCEDNNTTAAAPPAIVLSSDDEDNGRMRPFHLSQKIVLEPPPLEHHQHVTGMEDERPNNIEAVAPPVIVISSDDEDNEGRRPLRHQKIVLEPVGRFLERNSTGCEENKDCKEELESMPGKFDLGINKDVDVGAANNMDCAKSIDQTEDMETFPEIFANWIDEEVYQTEDMEMPGIFAEDMEMPGIFDIDTDLYQTEDMENLPGIFDFLIDEDVFQTEDVVAGISDVGTSENIGKGSPSASGNEESNNHSNSENNKRDVECIAPSTEDKILTGDIDVGEGNQKFQIEEQNHSNDIVEDDLSDMWTEMTTALECSKDIAIDPSADEPSGESGEECEHSLILKDDLGWVCRICGVVQQGIENIFEFQYSKAKRTKRTYMCESRNANNEESTQSSPVGVKSTRGDLMATEIYAHPRHRKQMKPHQVEGFNFLSSNLLTDKPGGCILAHAPGSGKTFLIISFVQSFLARFPHARPLVVLPKSVLATWKKEFRIWQVEDIPLYDFYTSKAENRSQQLDVLKQWVEQKSILFLGYTQFSTIICDHETSKTSVDCREILLEAPSILILDEGHTPRNESTNVLQSLARVKTPLKVVLSGTLYQNHVKEVFTILNLVRPKFLNLETSRAVMKCILSRAQKLGGRKQLKAGTNSAFCDLVEQTLQKDEDFKRKVAVIQDLREMTRKVLHYYKGDILDELPGLVEFTVVLNLSSRQKVEVEKLKELSKFAKTSGGSLVYMHPDLKNLSDRYPSTREKGSMVNNEKLDEILENLDVREGVKIKFFLNMLGLCESSGEKLLVFSQYILPLKLMERIAVKEKGWSPDKEIFGITGDSTSKHREWSMERFNISADAKVFFGSIKACGEGISLVGASRVLIMDVQLNPSVTRQAIGRAFRPGQKRKVYVYRLVAADSPEEEDHLICFRKELISKMWFEWNESCGHQDFDMKTVDVNECEDTFLESRWLQEDIKLLQKR